jgi:hypothetical protein
MSLKGDWCIVDFEVGDTETNEDKRILEVAFEEVLRDSDLEIGKKLWKFGGIGEDIDDLSKR